jgi:SAM-dependent methyltransferase
MGLSYSVIESIAREARSRPYGGTALMLGRQTVDLTPEQALVLLRSQGIDATDARLDLDTTTQQTKRDAKTRVSDIALFKALGFSSVMAMDISDYEGADIVHNLNDPVPDQYEGLADLIVDGSTLDNIFDPTTGLKNIAKMLRPGGRCFLLNCGNASRHFGGIPYTMFNPLWFLDYFVANDFAYCQVACAILSPALGKQITYTLSLDHACRRRGNGCIHPITSDQVISVMAFAEKGQNSTWDRRPTQHAYRGEAEWAMFSERVARYADANRPPIRLGAAGPDLDHVPAGWLRVQPDGSLRPPSPPATISVSPAPAGADSPVPPVRRSPARRWLDRLGLKGVVGGVR